LSSLLQNVGEAVTLKTLTIQHVDNLLHVKLILLFTTLFFGFSISSRSLLEGQLLQFLLQLEVAFLAGMQHQYFEKKVQEVYDSIRIAEEVILGECSLSDSIGLPTDPPLELFEV